MKYYEIKTDFLQNNWGGQVTRTQFFPVCCDADLTKCLHHNEEGLYIEKRKMKFFPYPHRLIERYFVNYCPFCGKKLKFKN